MNYSKLILLLAWFFSSCSCEVIEVKGKLRSDAGDEFLRSVHEIVVNGIGKEQILPLDHVRDSSSRKSDTSLLYNTDANKEHVIESKTTQRNGENFLPSSESIKHEPSTLNEDKETAVDNHRSKRGILGGEEERNPNDPKYRHLAEESLQKYVSTSVDKKPHTLLRVERVTTQLVSGTLTRINFVAAPILDVEAPVKKCFSKIWEQPWINKKEINVSCEIDGHVTIPGGETEKNPNDPKYRHLAEESLDKYVSTSADKKPYTLLRIERVTTQIEAGTMTRINFVAVRSSIVGAPVKKCFSKIWEQPWINKKEINVTCEIDFHRSKRQIIGGETEQDPNDTKYRHLAEESLQKYVSTSVDKKPHTLLRVERVTTQLVSGTLTRINFVAAPILDVGAPVKKCFSKIWEQPWINKKEINVSCEIDGHVTIPGGETEKNPNDPKYRHLAEESLDKYVSTSADKKPHTLLRIERVTTQIVAGTMTRINFVAVRSSILGAPVKKCFSKIWEQPGINKKEINVACEIDDHRSKRDIPGGETQQNPNDPKYRHLAEESLQKYVSTSVDKKPHTLLRVERVTTQLVSGTLTRINFVAAPILDVGAPVKKCFSKIWEQPWINKKEINVSCEIDGHVTIPGGETEKNPNDPKYRHLAEESLDKYVSTSADKKPHTLLRIERVTTQIVAGTMTRINFVAVRSSILGAPVKKCFSKIWEQPGINKKEINVACEIDDHRSKRDIPGGETQQNPNDPKYRHLAEESLQKYVSTSADKKPYTLLRVERVTTQVVAGFMTRIKFVAVPSLLDALSPLIKCFSEIWEQPWLNKKEIDVSCKIDDHRSKRDIAIGPMEENPNDPEYRHLAEESLQKYVSTSADKKPYTLLRVERVTTSLVSGIATSINFVAAPSSDVGAPVIKCFSEIWEQPWLNKKEIDVSCKIDDHRSKSDFIAGREMEQNPNDPEYRHLAEESLDKYVSTSADKKPYKLLRVERVTTQLVEGFMTRINFVAAPSLDVGAPVIKCFSEILEQAWLHKKEIDVSCKIDDHRSKRNFIEGGQMEQNPNDPEYRHLAEESLDKYVSTSADKKPYKLLRVERVTTQLVEGFMTRINFVAAPSLDVGAPVIKCFSEILEQAWLHKKEIDVSCKIDDHRSKRNFIEGGQMEQNPNDPEYRHLAEESLQKYVSTSADKKPYTLLRVERVTTQVVSGIATRINFVAAPSLDVGAPVIKCFSEIWEQAWLHKKEIDVSCENS